MGANLARLDDQVVRHLCRQMQDMTQVCEAIALKLLEVETRLEHMDSSLQGVAVAMERMACMSCLMQWVEGWVI